MILKAGTYTFNKVLSEENVKVITTQEELNNFMTTGYDLYYKTFESSQLKGRMYCCILNGNLSLDGVTYLDYNNVFALTYTNTQVYLTGNISYNGGTVFDGTGWNITDYPTEYRTTTLTEDAEVDDTFGTWYIANTNYNEINASSYLAEITYNGETIAQLNAGETATLSCKDKKMASDVVVKVNKVESKIPEGYIKPEGSLSIIENGTYPVANKEEVVVNVPTTTDGVPVEMLNQAVMNELIAPNSTKGEVGAVYLYRGEASDTYEYDALYILEEVSE